MKEPKTESLRDVTPDSFERRDAPNRVSWILHRTVNGLRIAAELWCFLVSGSAAVPIAVRLPDGRQVIPGGIEINREPGPCEDPHFAKCHAIERPCVHEGSGLAAVEFFGSWDGSDEAIWSTLGRWLNDAVEGAAR